MQVRHAPTSFQMLVLNDPPGRTRARAVRPTRPARRQTTTASTARASSGASSSVTSRQRRLNHARVARLYPLLDLRLLSYVKSYDVASVIHSALRHQHKSDPCSLSYMASCDVAQRYQLDRIWRSLTGPSWPPSARTCRWPSHRAGSRPAGHRPPPHPHAFRSLSSSVTCHPTRVTCSSHTEATLCFSLSRIDRRTTTLGCSENVC